MEKETKKTDNNVYPKHNGKELSEKQIKVVEALASRGIDAFAKGRFKVINQAIMAGGIKCYPHSRGQDSNKKKMELPADIVEVLNFDAYGIGVLGEVPEEQGTYLERVTEDIPLRSRTKLSKKKTKKSKK